MPQLRLRGANLPAALTGWLISNELYQPRFWATIWAEWLLTDLSAGTRGALLSSIERLYAYAEEIHGADQLDRALMAMDASALESILGGFLAKLRNESAIRGADRRQTWVTALRFVSDISAHLAGSLNDPMPVITSRLARLERLYRQLSPTPQRPIPPVRALPASVLEDLYDLFNPVSTRNPFRTDKVRWRNFLIFLMLLHLGLRRGEALILPANVVKDDFDAETGELRYWINVQTLEEDDDPRYIAPSIKTAYSRRQLPLSSALLNLINMYCQNYRGGPPHPYLLNSQLNKPLAIQSLNLIFAVVTENLTDRSKKILADRLKLSVTPHDLRHTSAVHRLSAYRAAGGDLETAIEKLRVFFGWSRTSEMPRLYARAYFETSLNDVWNESFDSFVDSIRGISGDL